MSLEVELREVQVNQGHIQNHHTKTGCGGEIRKYKDLDGEVKGFFCSSCKQEWFCASINTNRLATLTASYEPVVHHVVPTFCCIEISDTGYYVQWKNINVENKGFEPGDHVAWLRPILGYWHHAIVENVRDDSIDVIEWSTNIHQTSRKKWDLLGNCCYSPMYKAYYPEEVLRQNPPNVVLMRARARLEDTGYGLLADNCEHFATFCKTGMHRSNQLQQLKITLRAWLRRLLVSFFHLAIIISFAETIERYTGAKGKHVLGAVLLVVSELVHLMLVFCVTYCYDSRREGFRGDAKRNFSRACVSSSVKTVLQSLILVSFALIANIALLRLLDRKYGPWSPVKIIGAEICLGFVGGIIGNIIGFFIISFIPYPCCRK